MLHYWWNYLGMSWVVGDIDNNSTKKYLKIHGNIHEHLSSLGNSIKLRNKTNQNTMQMFNDLSVQIMVFRAHQLISLYQRKGLRTTRRYPLWIPRLNKFSLFFSIQIKNLVYTKFHNMQPN